MEEVEDTCTRCGARRMLPVNGGWRGEWRCDCGQANQIMALADNPLPGEAKAERDKVNKVRERALAAIERFERRETP